MAFELVKDPMDTQVELLPISSITVTAGDLLEVVAGSTTWALCTSTTNHFTRKAVALESATTAATEVKGIIVHPYQLWKAEANETAAATANGDRMTLTDANTVANTGTDVSGQAASFVQTGIVSGKLLGRILVGSGVDCDAA